MEATPLQPIINPEDKLPPLQTALTGLQHVVAMFGATVLAPLLMGFDPNVAVFFSGVATLLFLLIVKGKVPSYLGSSFAFLAPVAAATGYAGHGLNLNLDLALGGIIVCGAIYAGIGLLVMALGTRWIERLLPPTVIGAVIAVIGLNLAPVAVKNIGDSGIGLAAGLLTALAIALISVYAPRRLRLLPILLGGLAGYLFYYLICNVAGLAAPIDFTGVSAAAWFGWPNFTAPQFEWHACLAIAPVALVLVAENLGHVKAISTMTGRNLDSYLGCAFLGDGIATMVSGSGGGTGVTTYAENIGVMAITRNYSIYTLITAACIAMLLGLSPKFGAVIQTIPIPVLGGLALVVFGLITATAGRIWVTAATDFTQPKNLLTVGIALVMGAGDFTIKIGSFTLGGIGTGTLAAIVIYHLLNHRQAAAAPR